MPPPSKHYIVSYLDTLVDDRTLVYFERASAVGEVGFITNVLSHIASNRFYTRHE